MRLFVVCLFVMVPAMMLGVHGAWAACAAPAGMAGNDGLVLSFIDARRGAANVMAATEGQLIYDSDVKALRYCDGAKWVTLAPQPDVGGNVAVAGGVVAQGGFETPKMRLAFYRFSEADPAEIAKTLRWLHLKTDQTMDSRMQMVEFKGYEYSGARPIDARIGFYPYGVTGTIINTGADGTHPLSVYKSADGHVVLAIQARAYHLGFLLNQYGPTPTGMFPLTITATRWTAASTGAY